MKTIRRILVTGTVLALMPQLASAALLVNDNFESTPIGSQPAGWVFGTPLSASQVVAGSSPGGSGANSHVLNAVDTTVGSYGSLYHSFTRQTSSGFEKTIQLSLNFKVNSFSSSDYMIDMIDSTANAFSGPVVIRIDSSGLMSAYYGTTGAGTAVTSSLITGLGALNTTNWYQLNVSMDLSTQTYSVSVSNLDNSSQSGSLSSLYFYTNVQAVDRLLIRSSATNANANLNWMLDDVVIQSVPEPSTAMLVGLALLILLFFARKRRCA